MFSKFSVNRPVTITMIVLIIVLIGTVSLTKLPIDLLPSIEYPVAVVLTNYSGVGPEEMENLITRPLEDVLTTVENIDSIQSISREGMSLVILQFNFGTNMEFAALEMREKIDMVKGFLPDGADDPTVFKFDPNAIPIMYMTIESEGDLFTTQNLAEDIVKARLERIDGVASVDVGGGYSREIEVQLIESSIEGYGITLDYISQILAGDNLNLPGGEVYKGDKALNVRTLGEFTSLEEIRNTNIPLPRGGIIRLTDVADVNLINTDRQSIAKYNGEDTLEISIMKQSGVNTVTVSNSIKKQIESLEREYPNISMKIVFDQADFINRAIGQMIRSALAGGVLAVIILLLFLKNIRSTLIISLTIPISVIATFILMYFTNVTMNMMTLGGLALGIGMLVDNSIVVLENIFRHRTEGMNIREASILGANEVGMAVTASTLTTIAVFLPIVFVQGITSTIFRELAMTVTFALLGSLAIALTMIPMLSSKLLSIKSIKFDVAAEEEGKSTDKGLLNKLRIQYRKILNVSLNHRRLVFFLGIVVFAVSVLSLTMVGSSFFPGTDEGQLDISISLPTGAELKETEEIASEIEKILQDIPAVDYVFSSIGSGGGFGGMSASSANRASLTVMLKDLTERDKTTFEMADEIRTLTKDIPGAEIGVTSASRMMATGFGGGGISVSIRGDDIEILERLSLDIKEIIEQVEGTREVTSSLEEGIPEVQIRVDKDKAAQYGLTSYGVANNVRNTLLGKTATRFKFEGEEINVVIKGDAQYSESLSNLGLIPLSIPSGGTVQLSQVADIVQDLGPVTIQRQDQARVVTVSSETFGRDVQSVTDDINTRLADYQLPQGYIISYGGESELIEDAFNDLLLVLILAIVLVYMILAAQFESLVQPLAIMFTVPLALSGGFLGLFITGVDLSVPAIIGFIVLVGIVVNNAIVLVDYINKRRSFGEDRREAILNAGPIRLRPILMTAMTTIIGLLPLSLGIGEGSELQMPMAVVVIGGLLLSTILTLVYVPVVYTIIDDIACFLRRFLRIKEEGEPDVRCG
ncbi:MAG: efflux RND transporter permease subunit [Tissierellales bacterium]|nr:efflux RND transporter permease subunit [Tissierellales bacterium]MBN2827345.1 efflux RND transporter permease subunit [Tissierellales bacterium]